MGILGTGTSTRGALTRGLILSHEIERFVLRSTRSMNFSTMWAILFVVTVLTIGIGLPSRNNVTAVICEVFVCECVT